MLKFHKGMDYAVVMRPSETTEIALARLYGEDRTVTKYGNLFAGAPLLLKAAKAHVKAMESRVHHPFTSLAQWAGHVAQYGITQESKDEGLTMIALLAAIAIAEKGNG